MSKTFELAFKLGAKMNGGFTGTFRSAGNQVSNLNKAISELGEGSNKIDAFLDMERQIKKTSAAVDESTEKIGRLKAIVKASKSPSAEVLEQLETEKARRRELKRSLVGHRSSLVQMNQEMKNSGIDTARLVSEQNRLAKALDKVKSKQQALKSAMMDQGKNAQAKAMHGSRLQTAVGIGAAITAPIALASGAAMDFESAMADVKKVVNFKDPDGLEKLTQTIKSMPRKTGLPMLQSELAAIAAAGGQLGVSGENLPLFINTVGKMSTAFDMSADDAGNAAAKLSNVYGIPIEKIDLLGDAVNHLSDNTAAKAPQIIDTLMRVGGTAKMFGLSEQNTAALASTFISLGKSEEVAGTAINAMLNKLNTADKQGKKFQAALGDIGISASDLKDNIQEDAQGAVMDFLKMVKQVDKSEQAGVLTDLFGMEYSDDVALLVGSLDKYENALGLVGDKTKYAGSMQKEFKNRSDTTANNLKILRGSVNELAINLGSVFLPAITAGAKGLTVITGYAADFAAEHPNIMKVVGTIAGVGMVVTAGAIAASAAGYAYTTLKGGLLMARTAYLALASGQHLVAMGTGAMTAAQWALNAAMSANPITLMIAGLGVLIGLGAILYKKWEPFRNLILGLWEKVKGFFSVFSKVKSIIPSWMGGEDDEKSGLEKNTNAAGKQPVKDTVQELARKTDITAQGMNQNMSINYSPTVSVPTGANAEEVRRQVDESLQAANQDLEDKMKGVMAQEARLSFAN